jgi:pyruvate dehydrogenase E2 component (dihydrolipoamide acetyltransferase)
MKREVAMPALSDTMSNGRLIRWLKREGDTVKRGEAIAEVETDKALMDVEAFHEGYLSGPLAAVEAEYPVGRVIGYTVDTRDELVGGATAPSPAAGAVASPPGPSAMPPPQARASPPVPPPTAPVAPAPMSPASSPTRASPYARSLAHQLGVELGAQVSGGAPLHAADILAAVSHPVAPNLKLGPPYTIERNSGFREATARAMIACLGTPTFRVTAALPLAALIVKAKSTGRSLNLLLARACALTIKEHPLFNAVYTPDGLARRERIDIGIAVDSPEGLMTPVLRDVARKSLFALSGEWRVLLEKANTRRITPAEYSGATFYLSDLGVYSCVYSFESIIPQGAAALLSVAAVEGEKALCTLNCDHRVVFGGDAARFLQTLEKRIAELTGTAE